MNSDTERNTAPTRTYTPGWSPERWAVLDLTDAEYRRLLKVLASPTSPARGLSDAEPKTDINNAKRPKRQV